MNFQLNYIVIFNMMKIFNGLVQDPLISECNMFGRNVFVKRDDLIDLFGINGNKARKFFQLAQLSPFPLHVASIGGCQSNAMLSIATLVSRHPSSKFTYFTKEVPPHVKGATTTSSNYLKAVGLGMKVRHSMLQYCIS